MRGFGVLGNIVNPLFDFFVKFVLLLKDIFLDLFEDLQVVFSWHQCVLFWLIPKKISGLLNARKSYEPSKPLLESF